MQNGANPGEEAKEKRRGTGMTIGERSEWTDKRIKNYAYGSIVIGLIPLPLVDLAALTALQLTMLGSLSSYYGIPFSKEKGKKIISALVGASVPLGVTRGVCSLFKAVPFIGFAASAVSMSALSGASTYAIGKVFVQHFESGGTFLNFDAAKVKEYFEEEFKKGQKMAEEYRNTEGK